MRANTAPEPTPDPALDALIDAACAIVAPCWPLDRFIAVNPFHGITDTPFRTVARQLPSLCGASLYMPRDYYRAAWREGRIRPADLEATIAEAGNPCSPEDCIAFLGQPSRDTDARPLLSELHDARRDLRHQPAWADTITAQIGRFCAGWFDRAQSDWQRPAAAGLYRDWIEAMQHEHGIAMLMKTRRPLRAAAALPRDARGLIGEVLEELPLSGEAARDLLRGTLLRINGWAAWCAYRRWQARLEGGEDALVVDLLAIRLAWEQLVDDGERGPASPWQRWRKAWVQPAAGAPEPDFLFLWQCALEAGYQSRLIEDLGTAPRSTPRSGRPRAQAAFCIDVRSEVIRRALETADPEIRTLGFAGFFGLPVAYRETGSERERPQLPGLLKPAYTVAETSGDAAADKRRSARRRKRLLARARMRPFFKLPASAFTLVESLGPGYAGAILRDSLPRVRGLAATRVSGERPPLRLVLPRESALETRAGLAADILRTMALTRDFAPYVLLVGHASQAVNNAHKAGLDCGACGGQSGEVNVRTLAGILNDRYVRRVLAGEGIDIPADTRFLPALHNTTTDEIVILEAAAAPGSATELERIQRSLREASAAARTERAGRLGLGALAARPRRLHSALRERALDWSQTRPEWGLADNAAFVIGPRELTAGLDLEGRVFLHEYDPNADTDGGILEQLLTAPMIVTNWINMQYYASTVDNRRFGCGNKVLHNVVGGRIGVFEGNGGDLRVGLSLQSLHDGERWMHTPLRLSVFVAASREALEHILEKQELVCNLVHNEWLFLFRLAPPDGLIERYRGGAWIRADGRGPGT